MPLVWWSLFALHYSDTVVQQGGRGGVLNDNDSRWLHSVRIQIEVNATFLFLCLLLP